MASPTRYVAFLRGINVGRAKRIAMADLRAVAEGVGHVEVATHLQSGNLVFTAAGGARAAARHASALTAAIHEHLQLDVEVVVRTRDQVAAVVALDPLHEVATDPSRYLVLFLSARPAAAQLGSVDAAARAPEVVELHGSEAYLWCPDGVHRSKVPQALDRTGVVSTGRNWTTVTRVLALMDGT